MFENKKLYIGAVRDMPRVGKPMHVVQTILHERKMETLVLTTTPVESFEQMEGSNIMRVTTKSGVTYIVNVSIQ